ncbi:MAG: 50S ribosomal protein L11 methyltransferase, partial [Clostridiales bacterium]|nr:50S ribosomal protein L11 methyltransferase [Clostridiales bacterium]
MNWYQFTIHTVSEAVEAIAYMLEDIGFQGVEIQDPQDILSQEQDPTAWDYIDEDLLAGMDPEDVTVSSYRSFANITSDHDLEDLTFTIQTRLKEISQYLPIGKGTIEISVKNEDDWANAWKKYYKPFRLGKHIYIVPTWIEPEDIQEDDIRLTMDPGMAFG